MQLSVRLGGVLHLEEVVGLVHDRGVEEEVGPLVLEELRVMVAGGDLAFDRVGGVLQIHHAVVSLCEPDLSPCNLEFFYDLVLARDGHLRGGALERRIRTEDWYQGLV